MISYNITYHHIISHGFFEYKIVLYDFLQAWNSFVSTVAQRKHRRELIRRVLGRMQHMMLAAAFDGLDTAVDLAIAQREAVAKAIQRWRMPRLQWGFDLMVQYLEVQQAEIKERAYQQAKQVPISHTMPSALIMG